MIIITWADPLCECIDPGISHTSLVLTQSSTSHQRRPTCRRTELRKPNNLYDTGTVQKREEDESVHRDYWPGRKRSFHPNNSAMETAEDGFGDGGYLLMIAKFEPELWQCSTVEFGLFSYFVIRLIWTLLNRILLCHFSSNERNLIGFMLELFLHKLSGGRILFTKDSFEFQVRIFEFLIGKSFAIPSMSFDGGCRRYLILCS